jgi:hypothetical protein
VLFGILGDAAGVDWATVGTAVTAMATIPVALALASRLQPATVSHGQRA